MAMAQMLQELLAVQVDLGVAVAVAHQRAAQAAQELSIYGTKEQKCHQLFIATTLLLMFLMD
jgi:hypothetical protein